MLRNTDRLKSDTFGPEAFVKVVESVAQVVDLMGSEDGAVTLNYQTDDCEVGDLVPAIQIGVIRVRKEQSRPLTAVNAENADG